MKRHPPRAARRDVDTPLFKTILHLAYRARRHPEDMEVLHDALIEYYPEYRETIEQAEATAQRAGTRQVVFFEPKRAIKYERMQKKLRGQPSWAKRPATLKAYLEDNMPLRFNIARVGLLTWMGGKRPERLGELRWAAIAQLDVHGMTARLNRDAFLNLSGWQRAVATYVTRRPR